MWGDQLAGQCRLFRAIEVSRNGRPGAEVAKREENGIKTIYWDPDTLQAGGYAPYTERVLRAFIDTFRFEIPVDFTPTEHAAISPREYSTHFSQQDQILLRDGPGDPRAGLFVSAQDDRFIRGSNITATIGGTDGRF
jgi:hypothetical protein